MIKVVASLAAMAVLAFAAGGAAQAQERTMRRVLSGPSPALHKAMTESQARRACNREMRGSRESRGALRQKMRFCVNEKMQGN